MEPFLANQMSLPIHKQSIRVFHMWDSINNADLMLTFMFYEQRFDKYMHVYTPC